MLSAYLIYFGVLNFQFLVVGNHAKYNVSEHLPSRRHWKCILVSMIKGNPTPSQAIEVGRVENFTICS
jgi:hypothetical protein